LIGIIFKFIISNTKILIFINSKMIYLSGNANNYLANLVIWHRKKSKITQNDLALAANVSRTAVQSVEKGNLSIQLDTLLKILQVLNINLKFDGPLVQLYESLNNAKS
jgi:HTH-type transcriptional regulator/antitoxin HipB